MKKIAVLFLAICAFAALPGATLSASADGKTKVVVSEFRGIGWVPVHIAYQLGYFSDEGLDVEFVVYKDGPIAFQGMHAGSSHFCLLSQEPILCAFDEGLKSELIAAVLKTRLYAFVSRPEITQVSQLKGKTVFAGMPGSAPYSFVWSILKNAGLDPEKDVTFVNMEYGASAVALGQGHIDASYMNNDNRPEFAKIKHNVLMDTADLETRKSFFGAEKFEAEVITTTKKFSTEHPETVQKFVNAVVKGLSWLQKHSDSEAAELVHPLFEAMSKEALGAKIGLFRVAYSEDGYISREGYEAVERFALRQGILKKAIGYDNFVNMTYVDAAKAGLSK